MAYPASAHEWYEPWCCDDRDCRPARLGEVTEQDGGYFVHSSGQHFTYETARTSQDNQFHVCQYQSSGGYLQMTEPRTVTRCLYVPMQGV